MKPILIEHTNPINGSFAIREHIGTEFKYPYHFHNSYEITYIQQGKGTRLVGNSLASFEQGDLVMMGPNLPHCWRNEPETLGSSETIRAIVIRFAHDFAGKDFFDLPENNKILQLLKESKGGLEIAPHKSKEIGKAMERIVTLDGIPRLTCLLHILDDLAQSLAFKKLSLANPFAPKKHEIEIMEKVMNHITQHYLEKITVEQVADIAGMNRSAFCRYFKKTYQKTLITMINELRVSHACRLIREGKYAITQICYMSGFNNYSNFERMFKLHAQFTPKGYREKFQML